MFLPIVLTVGNQLSCRELKGIVIPNCPRHPVRGGPPQIFLASTSPVPLWHFSPFQPVVCKHSRKYQKKIFSVEEPHPQPPPPFPLMKYPALLTVKRLLIPNRAKNTLGTGRVSRHPGMKSYPHHNLKLLYTWQRASLEKTSSDIHMGGSAYAGTRKPIEKESNHLNSIANGSFYFIFSRDENKSKKTFWHIPLG